MADTPVQELAVQRLQRRRLAQTARETKVAEQIQYPLLVRAFRVGIVVSSQPTTSQL